SCPTVPARPRTRRSATSSSPWAPARSRREPRHARSGWPSTTACCGSPTSWATRRATWGAPRCPARPGAGTSDRRVTRFIDRGAITAGWVGVGMAITIAMSFLLVIPIQPIYWYLALVRRYAFPLCHPVRADLLVRGAAGRPADRLLRECQVGPGRGALAADHREL